MNAFKSSRNKMKFLRNREPERMMMSLLQQSKEIIIIMDLPLA